MSLVIKAESLSFAYPKSALLFEDISLSLNTGSAVEISGPNGCGKSTFLLLLLGILQPTKGSIEKGSNANSVVFLPTRLGESFLLPWYSVERNLEFFRILRGSNYDISSLLLILSFLLDANVEKIKKRKVHMLSTGQKAALSYVCAIATSPSLMVLDETFANFSDQTAERCLNDLRDRMSAGLSVVFTSHDNRHRNQLSAEVVALEMC